MKRKRKFYGQFIITVNILRNYMKCKVLEKACVYMLKLYRKYSDSVSDTQTAIRSTAVVAESMNNVEDGTEANKTNILLIFKYLLDSKKP